MPYEDKFKSVREHGPREGTDPDPDRKARLEEQSRSDIQKARAAEVKKLEQAKTRSLVISEQMAAAIADEEDPILIGAPGEFVNLSPDDVKMAPSPRRPVPAVLSDLEKMIVDEDSLFVDLPLDEAKEMLLSLVEEARTSYQDLTERF
jgi:hypothetical protein